MDAGELGNGRPRFGLHAVSQKLRTNNYKTLLGFNLVMFLSISKGPARQSVSTTHFRIRMQWHGCWSPSLTLTGPRVIGHPLLLQTVDQCI